VSNVVVGSRVYGTSASGSYAEYTVSHAGAVFVLPENIDYAEGALVFVPYTTAYYSLADLCRCVACLR
jgi:NADPH:quinone reductase-like Zn-dependent oxidoreductase